jgi:hypothetical protein
MSRQERPRPSSFLANLRSGDYGFLERTGRLFGNVGRKIVRRSGCCGNYGDPGC